MNSEPTRELAMSPDLLLPIEAVTETFAILAKRGSGKTYTAAVMVEEFLDAGLPVVVVDPVGVWWGLRSNAAGDGPGRPVVIFGGDHADLPLTEGAGALLADAIVDDRVPAVLDLSGLSKSASRRFMADFAERLYQRNRDALHLVIDEADAFAPQRVDPGQQRLLGAIEDLVRRGRARGLGCTLITQRPAVLNKDVLTQAEVLIALRMTGPRDVAAIDEWVRLHADTDQAVEVKRSLPSLPIGTAWVWSPGWLDVLQRIQVRARTTFDSSATPKPGERRIEPRGMAEVDLAVLGEKIAALEEDADQKRSDDPKALRRRIADLEQQLRDQPSPEAERIEVHVVSDAHVTALRHLVDGMREALDHISARLDRVDAGRHQPPAPAPRRETPPPRPERPSRPRSTAEGPSPLPRAQRLILRSLVQHGEPLTAQQVAILTGYSAKGGGFANALGALRSAGLIEGRRERLAATAAGVTEAGDVPPLPTGDALVEHWISQLPKAPAALLRVLVDARRALSADELADAAGYTASGGGFANALGRLRTLGLAHGDRSAITAAPELLDEERP